MVLANLSRVRFDREKGQLGVMSVNVVCHPYIPHQHHNRNIRIATVAREID